MKRTITAVMAILMTAVPLFARPGNITFGLVSSRYHNFKAEQRISEMKNPMGCGIFAGYILSDKSALYITGERYSGSMETEPGDETSIRTTVAACFFPVSWNRARLHISSGLVYTHQAINPDAGSSSVNHLFQLRQGIGIDYMLTHGLSLYGDIAICSDGLDYAGNANSFGFRYSF